MENSSLYKEIKMLIGFIEENIKEKITLDDLAMTAGISKFYLSRIFHELSSMPLMKYIRLRKLTQSLFELLNTDLNVIDIAEEYGFNYQQSYIRSFVSAFGISPSKFRKEKSPVVIQNVINIDNMRGLGQFGIATKPHFAIYPSFYTMGIKHKIYDTDDQKYHVANIKGNEFYYKHRYKIENVINPQVYFGIVETVWDKGYSYYIPSVQVSAMGKNTDRMVCYSIPTQYYAVFKYIGVHHARYTHINNLQDLIDYIYNDWLPTAGYTQSAPYHFERIDVKISRNDYCEVDIYLPIVRMSL